MKFLFKLLKPLLLIGVRIPAVHSNAVEPGPLHHAFLKNKAQDFERLLQQGADPNLSFLSNGVETYLINEAVKIEDETFLKLLLPRAQLNSRDHRGKPALHNAFDSGHPDRAYELLKHGAEIDVQDSHLQTALFCLTQQGHYKLAFELLNFGADPRIPDDGGFTVRMLIQNDQLPPSSEAHEWQQKLLKSLDHP